MFLSATGELNFLEQPPVTDGAGQTVGHMTSIKSGKKTIHARNVDDNIEINSKAVAEFISTAANQINIQNGNGAFTANQLQGRYRGGWNKAMHNIYLQLLVEHGIQGLFCFLLLIFVVGLNHGRRFILARMDPEESAIFLGLLGFWIGLCGAHFFVNPFFMLQINGQFWVMSACALRHGSEPRSYG